MFQRIIQTALLLSVSLLPTIARAEEPDAEVQDFRQQMQQLGAQVMQNMIQKNINPQEFFGDVREQMQNGTFDMSALQQKLVDKGLIDQDTVTQMQTKAQTAGMNSIRRKLEVTDAEWAILLPKIQRVIAANTDAGGSNPMRGMMLTGMMGGQAAKSEVAKLRTELQALASLPTAKPEEIQSKMAALRDATKKAKEELATAQKELLEILTIRQESILLLLGLL